MTHVYDHDSSTGDEHVWICPDCGRRIVTGPRGFTVIDRGDEYIQHVGCSTPDLLLSADFLQRRDT